MISRGGDEMIERRKEEVIEDPRERKRDGFRDDYSFVFVSSSFVMTTSTTTLQSNL
jgi:hypothetical protein